VEEERDKLSRFRLSLSLSSHYSEETGGMNWIVFKLYMGIIGAAWRWNQGEREEASRVQGWEKRAGPERSGMMILGRKREEEWEWIIHKFSVEYKY